MEALLGWGAVLGFFAVIGFIGWIFELISDNKSLEESNDRLHDEIRHWKERKEELDTQEKDIDWKRSVFSQLLAERSKNFPLVGEIWANLTERVDSYREDALRHKTRPAPKAADEVRAIKLEKRELIKELKLWEHKSKNYESVYPWLAEELAEDIENEVNADIHFSIYTQEEREDPVTNYISPDDYRKLSVSDRNQLALDRYWQRGRKTKWMIGMMYERYVGYLYEVDGWQVTYTGIKKRYEDLGRDLVAVKGDQVHVVQCKNWSKFKSIYENHIFQLFGTTYSMKKDYPNKTVIPVFYTSTNLSDVAREFAKLLQIQVHELAALKAYPVIKCNSTPTGKKIYHLPFDQKYDDIIFNKGSKKAYVKTVKEAEEAGFRRAYRWSGVKG